MRSRDPIPHAIASSLAPGTQLNGTYEIVAPISCGGMGEVYRGINIATGDPVAIKAVLPAFAADQLIIELFRKEARILNQVSHDAIVRYYGFASDPVTNRSYMAMEFVDGPSLARRIETAPLSLGEVSILTQRLADGLLNTHELGIVHRDISPENVILPNGLVSKAKIIDFGIAKSTSIAGAGTLIGTSFAGRYNYASPEQVGMFRPAGVSPRSDIYSLGLVLAAACLGSPIDMSGTLAEITEKRKTVPDLARTPVEMRALLAGMLQPNPAERIGSMREVRDWQPVAPTAQSRETRRSSRYSKTRDLIAEQPVHEKQASGTPMCREAKTVLLAEQQQAGKPWELIGLGLTAAFLVAGVAGWFYLNNPKFSREVQVLSTRPLSKTPALNSAIPHKLKLPQSPPDGTSGEIVEKTPHGSENVAAIDRSPAAIAQFINSYDGRNCFLAWPVDVQSKPVKISGIGAETAKFQTLESDFQTWSGSNPKIALKQITVDQCPAVDALKRLSTGISASPVLEVLTQHISVGGILTGEAYDTMGRHVDLFHISEKGETLKLTRLINNKRFSLQFSARSPLLMEEPLPQLLVLIASPKPLQAIAQISDRVSKPAQQIFDEVLRESENDGNVSMAVQFFRIDPIKN